MTGGGLSRSPVWFASASATGSDVTLMNAVVTRVGQPRVGQHLGTSQTGGTGHSRYESVSQFEPTLPTAFQGGVLPRCDRVTRACDEKREFPLSYTVRLSPVSHSVHDHSVGIVGHVVTRNLENSRDICIRDLCRIADVSPGTAYRVRCRHRLSP